METLFILYKDCLCLLYVLWKKWKMSQFLHRVLLKSCFVIFFFFPNNYIFSGDFKMILKFFN